jgi:DNA-directed RNA polymerase specialized sigma24 family protein
MGKPYSEDLRRGVVQAIEAGHTYEETADLCGVSIRACRQLSHRTTQTSKTPARNVLASLSKRVAIAL